MKNEPGRHPKKTHRERKKGQPTGLINGVTRKGISDTEPGRLLFSYRRSDGKKTYEPDDDRKVTHRRCVPRRNLQPGEHLLQGPGRVHAMARMQRSGRNRGLTAEGFRDVGGLHVQGAW